ncbi:MAG: hypothetical protein KA257_04945, partial [Opitutaceae bacterium]|nr:hypothetical protein [Opitutaceae bacterium]
QRLTAPLSGQFQPAAASGPVAAGAVLGRFADTELRAAVETSQLRLRIAREQAADALAELPARRQEARQRLGDLASQLALAEAVAQEPNLRRDLPAAVQASLQHADPTGLRAQLKTAQAQADRLEAVDYAETSPARLQVLEAERALREAEERLRAAVITAPLAGLFQPAPGLTPAAASVLLNAGQEIGVLRDVSRLVAAVPALSPYLARLDLARTVLRIRGAGGRDFTALFHTAVTEATPVAGETRVFLYEFSAADSAALANMIQTNVSAQILLAVAEPVALVAKLQAALAHPAAFRDGWAAGVARVWPGWQLTCEGEDSLGLAPVKP